MHLGIIYYTKYRSFGNRVEREMRVIKDYDWCCAWCQSLGCILPNNTFWEWNSFNMILEYIKREQQP